MLLEKNRRSLLEWIGASTRFVRRGRENLVRNDLQAIGIDNLANRPNSSLSRRVVDVDHDVYRAGNDEVDRVDR